MKILQVEIKFSFALSMGLKIAFFPPSSNCIVHIWCDFVEKCSTVFRSKACWTIFYFPLRTTLQLLHSLDTWVVFTFTDSTLAHIPQPSFLLITSKPSYFSLNSSACFVVQQSGSLLFTFILLSSSVLLELDALFMSLTSSYIVLEDIDSKIHFKIFSFAFGLDYVSMLWTFIKKFAIFCRDLLFYFYVNSLYLSL